MTGDPRYELLIRKDPYRLHGQMCPVWRSVRKQPHGTAGTSSACDCWRRGEVLRLLAELDAADSTAGIARVAVTARADG
jgi:RNase P/RNase MRP subunit p30